MIMLFQSQQVSPFSLSCPAESLASAFSGSEDYFKVARKNQFEEALLRTEEERFEVLCVISLSYRCDSACVSSWTL